MIDSLGQSLSPSDPTTVSAVHHTTTPHAWAQHSSVATPIIGLVAIQRESIRCTYHKSYHVAWLPFTNADIICLCRADCADGTCYKGACEGDSVFSTTGQCGSQNGNKQCAGVWRDCCNAAGKCGTGEDFCGTAVCQLGNCTIPKAPTGIPSWWGGNTTGGTCGPSNQNTFNVIWGDCCNSNGICGSDPSDCGQAW